VSPPTLFQFRFSHFNEKARWALDWKGIPHRRRSLVPGLHIPRVVWMTGQKSTPVLVLDGKRITDSTSIVAALEALKPTPPLYPATEPERRRALELEDFFDTQLGPPLRRVLFDALLPDADYSTALFTAGRGAALRTVYRATFPALRAAMRVDMGIDAKGVAAAHPKVTAALDRIAAELGPSGYLVGDTFTVADLTAAALLSPITTPPEYAYPLPGPYPGAAAALCATFAAHPAFRWARDIYHRHRGHSAEVGKGSALPAA
jgi:glutathione S-transferase